MTTTFRPLKVCVLDHKDVSHLGLPLMCKPDDSGERDANAILIPNTPAYRAAIASVGRGKKKASKGAKRGK